ncbi:indolepyruvate/phenylpyruvate decarboxylase [Azospirillum sp. TSO22-1]|uniref:indolepyruvate/phenylpyruvate decarboxylase n=1 Tax=Azospirillum sp. TSO22-1 TaxID=716789 RepID=UPI000D60D5DD|nr:indolepyruvate/phenylpyruvate decarboxylase [Azospirillum sp. TSO22-1]PWC41378.1 indole-3-pyruvate decarboxylase [Azospirillum sp. TSO22-1]
MRLAEALLHALKERGAQTVFGIPGDFALPFFKVMEETKILPLVTLSHEPAVGFAADAAARAGTTLGVAAVTYGAGALNMVNAVAGAYAEKSPVVVISGAPGAGEGGGLLLHHQGKTLDTQYRVFQEITVAQARLDDPATAPAEIARVLGAAQALQRPVYLELPRDMVNREVGPVGPDPVLPVDGDALAACADEVLAQLRKATSPVLMVCVEVRRYGLEDKVAELARRLGVPVVTSFMGRGLLSGKPWPPRGTYLGVAGDPAITKLVEESDGLFLLGTLLSDTNFAVSERKLDLRKTIHAFDREVTLGYHSYRDIPLDRLVDALLERLPASDRVAEAQGRAYPAGLIRDAQPIGPMDIACGVNDMAAKHGDLMIASDIGDCLFTAMDIRDAGLMAPGYYAGMGFGVPAGLGAQAATGKRLLILVGDGAFQMTGWELGNARRFGLDPIVVLFNNASWEMLRTFQPESAFNNLDDWHYADMAKSLGGDGMRVSTRGELGAALDTAWETRGRFQLIEAMIPRGVLSDTLARFVKGQKRLHKKPAE